MKREKKQIKQKSTQQNNRQKISENSQNKTTVNFFNIWTLVGLIVFIGIVSLKKYLIGDYLFFFKDIGSDTINQAYPAIIHKMSLLQESFFSNWSFFKGMGDSYVTIFPSDPLRILKQTIDFIAIKIWGESYLIYGRFLRIFVYYFLFSGIISYLYFRTISTNKFSSYIGALAISFSGYMLAGSAWGFSAHIFNAMFLLFSFEQLFLKKRWFFFPFAIILLSTNPFVLFIYSVFLFIYSIFRFFSEESNRLKEYLFLSGKMIVLGFIGLMMNFAQVFQSFMKMYNSPRVAGNSSYNNLLTSGKEIIEHDNILGTTILRFFSNDILGNGSNFKGWSNYLEAPLFYIGILTLLLFPQVFIYLNKRKKIVFGSFLGFWLLTLVFPYLRYTILAFTGDYFRYGFDFFIPFTLLFFSIFTLNNLNKTFKLNIPLLLITLIVLIVLLFIPYKSIPSEIINQNLRNVIVFLLVVYSVMIYLFSKQKYNTLAQYGIVILLIFELSYFSYQSYADRDSITKTEFKNDKAGYADGTIKAINYIKSIDKTSFFRTEKDYQSGNSIHGSLNDALAQGYYGTTSYSSFNQLNYVHFLEEVGIIQKGDETATRWLTGLRGYPLLQSFGNIKYHLSKSKKPEFLKYGFDSLKRIKGVTILKNKYYLPFGYTYDKYIDYNDFKNLTEFQISVKSLNLIFQELSMFLKHEDINPIVEKLKTLLNKRYKNKSAFTNDISKTIGTNNKKIIGTIKKHSTQNFKNQIALLNAFVYKEGKPLNISEFQEIDTSKIKAVAGMFNFEIYKNLIDSLKQDTLQVISFKQSEIVGNIKLNKTKLLFLTIPFDEGWKIKVNKKEERLERVSFGFSGIVLPKGEHKIKLYFVPRYSILTKTISSVSIMSFWIYLFIMFLKNRNKKKDN